MHRVHQIKETKEQDSPREHAKRHGVERFGTVTYVPMS